MAQDTDFLAGNQLPASFFGGGKPGSVDFFLRLKNRDIELLGLISPFSAPKFVGAGSLIPISGDGNGDEVVTINESKKGFFYYNNFTINSGITVTADDVGLIIIAKTKITIVGTIISDFAGRASGSSIGIVGRGGLGGGGGGGFSVGGSTGGGFEIGGVTYQAGGAGGAPISTGSSAPSFPSIYAPIILTNISQMIIGGASGGLGGNNGSGSGGSGGRGGGVIILVAPTIDLSSGVLQARGQAGGNPVIAKGGGGGGGGGVIYVKTKNYVASPAPTFTLTGGAGGSATTNGGAGGAGSPGFHQIDIF